MPGQRVRCKKCGDVIQSIHRHDWRPCKCGAIFVDGGGDYFRFGGNLGDAEREDGSPLYGKPEREESQMSKPSRLIFVDCEAIGPAPEVGEMTEFGAVHYPSREMFYGLLVEVPRSGTLLPYDPAKVVRRHDAKRVFTEFAAWLELVVPPQSGNPVFVSDNPAFDWQWINHGFHKTLGRNPFGHSARRIGDFYAGLCGDFRQTQRWKKLRVTPHTHNPVDDAMGNLEAFERLLKGER